MPHNDSPASDAERGRMKLGEDGAAGGAALQVRWGLRRYAALIAVCAMTVSLALPWLLREQTEVMYEAEALVVARTSDIPLEALPRYSEAVFYNGAVARHVADVLGMPGRAESLIPEKLSVVAGQDSIVTTVLGRDPDPEVAAAIANEGAEVYVSLLNRPGPELGVFNLSEAAVPPQTPVRSLPSDALGAAFGALSGAALGLGLLALLLIARKPVVDPARLDGMVGAPVLGTLVLPRSNPKVMDPRHVPGLAPLARRLADVPASRIQVVSPPASATQRRAAGGLLAAAIARRRPAVHVLATADERPAPAKSKGGAEGSQTLELVDVARPLDIDVVDDGALTLFVLAEGTPESAVLALIADYTDMQVFGIVFVRIGKLARLRPRHEAGTEALASKPAPASVQLKAVEGVSKDKPLTRSTATRAER